MNVSGNPNFSNRFAVLNKARQRQRLVLIGVASCAVILLVLLIMYFGRNQATASKLEDTAQENQSVSKTQENTISVYVLSKNLQAGEQIKSEDLEQVLMSKDNLPSDVVKEKSEVAGTYAVIALTKGEAIKKSSVTIENSKTEVLNITPGMRAVTIEVNAKRGIEGWALPGTRVDVVLTYMSDGELTSKVVVENTRVLSNAGDSTNKSQDRLSARRPVSGDTTVTLETTPKDALKIETAQQKGTLSLHMRSLEDSKTSGVEQYTENELDKQDKEKVSDKKKKDTCRRGKMKIDGKEYVVDCDGQIIKE